MQKLLETVHKNIKFKAKQYTIDNFAFKCHYKFTTTALVIATILITSQELIGENIKCIVDKGIPQDVINRFCYFMSTFTVVKYLNNDMVNSHLVAHPGVGAMGAHSDEPIKQHAYYQWVPFVLVLQAFMFYLPHFIWKNKEGKRLQKLVSGLEFAAYASSEKEIKVGKSEIPKKSDISKRLRELQIAFTDHLVANQSWTFWFVACEILNLFNLMFQVYLTNVFLNGQFLTLGPEVARQGIDNEVGILDVVFPKMTKCTFHKFGPSGTIQAHDAMCVMALNIINEKIFTFLWFWYAILFGITLLALLWRCLSWFLHHRSRGFNRMVFSWASNGQVRAWEIVTVTKKCNYKEWLFLVYLCSNMDGLVFNKFFEELAKETNPYLNHELEPIYATAKRE